MRLPLLAALLAGNSLLLPVLQAAPAEKSIVINEIHYAPADKTKPTEFVELFNSGDEAVDVSGWKIEGVEFTIPPNTAIPAKGFLCLAEDVPAFKEAFGMEAVGPWSGKLKNSGERIQVVNAKGDLIDFVEYKSTPPWPAHSKKSGLSLELINPHLDRTSASSWRAGGPTPGARNSVASDKAPPAIEEVKHEPACPKSGEALTVTAKITDKEGIGSATLAYQVVEPGAYIRLQDPSFEKEWKEIEMRDDGQAPDARAGDGIYTAKLPAEESKHRRLLRYRVLAHGHSGLTTRAPVEGEPVPNFAAFVYDGIPAWTGAAEPGKTEPITFTPQFLNTLPTFQLIALDQDVEGSQWDHNYNHRDCQGTLVFNGVVYDHIRFQNRGHASTYNAGKNKWGFSLAKGHTLEMQDPTGRELKKHWSGFAMNACASPWVLAHRGMAGLDEWVSTRIYELSGVPTPRHIPMHFRVIDNAEEAPAKNQYGGDLWGLYMAVEDPDGSFLEERDLPDGNIYSPESKDKAHQVSGQPKEHTDFDEFMTGSRASKSEKWWVDNMNLPSLYSFRAASHIAGNVDLREGANHYLYHPPDNHWVPIPWDLDMMLVPRQHQSGRIDQERCVEYENLRVQYGNRCRELLDLLVGDASPNGGQVGQLVAEYRRLMTPAGPQMSWPELDRAMWNEHPRTTDKGGFYRNPMRDVRMGGIWERKLETPDFAGMCKYVLDYVTNSRPADKPWKINDGDPRGYGYGYLNHDAHDDAAPARPGITYTGAPAFPANALRFKCSEFSDPQGTNTFAAVQYRLGRIAAPGAGAWSPGEPFRYEIEDLWTSDELTSLKDDVHVPRAIPWTGSKYRARARVKDNTGRWSRWSEPVEFVAGRATR